MIRRPLRRPAVGSSLSLRRASLSLRASLGFRGAGVGFRGAGLGFRGASLALGLLTVAWPLAWAPGWAYVVAAAGAAAALAAALTGWRPGPALAVAAAIFSFAFSRAGTAALTAEGLFILVYLIVSAAPVGLTQLGRWLRHQARLCAAGVIASGAVLGALALHPTTSAWLTIVGLVAAVAAYLVALPSWRAIRRSPRE